MSRLFYDIADDRKKNVVLKLLRFLCFVLSLIYRGVVIGRAYFYKIGLFPSRKLIKPVICIGNLTVGGTGKTPLVILVVKKLMAKGYKPAVLTRGYMPGKNAESLSDEVQLLKDNLKGVPIIVGKNRYEKAAGFLKSNHADVFVMDDGFQHLSLKRDLNILAINTLNPFGNKHLLPRGILREPLKALKRADVAVLTKYNPTAVNDTVNEIRKISSNIDLIKTVYKAGSLVDIKTGRALDVSQIIKNSVCMLCAIADPASFALTLEELHIKVEKKFIYPDHHDFSVQDIDRVQEYCRKNSIRQIVATQKDAVKLKSFVNRFFPEMCVYFLAIEAKVIEGEDLLEKRIFNLFSR